MLCHSDQENDKVKVVGSKNYFTLTQKENF